MKLVHLVILILIMELLFWEMNIGMRENMGKVVDLFQIYLL